MQEKPPKQQRPDWKVGDVIYYQVDGQGWWYEKQIISETKSSWLVMGVDAPEWKRKPNSWYFRENCISIPKNMRRKDKECWKVWIPGTKLSMLRQQWVGKYADQITKELSWQGRFKNNAHVLREVARAMGMDEIVATYPEEDTNAKTKPDFTPAVEAINSDRTTEA
jgi:hypothetical protein